MAGLYIPKLKMPACCGECWFLCKDDYPFWCGRSGLSVADEDLKHRRSDCDLLEVTDHGELIDRGTIHNEAARISGPMTGDGWDNWGVYGLIERQPTIIPADKK